MLASKITLFFSSTEDIFELVLLFLLKHFFYIYIPRQPAFLLPSDFLLPNDYNPNQSKRHGFFLVSFQFL